MNVQQCPECGFAEQEALQADAHALDAERLAHMTGPALQALLHAPAPLPLLEGRARLLREARFISISLAAHAPFPRMRFHRPAMHSSGCASFASQAPLLDASLYLLLPHSVTACEGTLSRQANP